MALLMYTFGVFVQSGGLRINARVLFAGALTDANLSVVLGREGIFFSFFFFGEHLCFSLFSGLSVPPEEFFLSWCFNSFLPKKRIYSSYFVTLKNIKNRYYVVEML